MWELGIGFIGMVILLIIFGLRKGGEAPTQPCIIFTGTKPETERPTEREVTHDHEVLNHFLIYGHAGTGKTTFCELIHAMLCEKYGRQVKLHTYIAGQLRTAKAIEELISKIKYGDVIFIDEVASLRLSTEELLYSVLQDHVYYPIQDSLVIDEDHSIHLDSEFNSNAKKVPKCTFLAATTDAGTISTPFRDRFPLSVELERMTSEQLSKVAQGFNQVKTSKDLRDYVGQQRAKDIAKMHIDSLDFKPTNMSIEASVKIGEAALGVPRVANNFRLHASARAGALRHAAVREVDVMYALQLIGVDKNGLMPIDRRLVKYLLSRDNKAVGVNALAAVCGCSKNDITEMMIPRMSYAGMLTKNNRSMNELTKEAVKFYEQK